MRSIRRLYGIIIGNPDLVIGTAVIAILLWIFGDLTEGVITQDTIVRFDYWINSNIILIQSPVLTRVMRFITNLGSPIFISFLSVAAGAIFIWRRKLPWAEYFALAMIGGAALNFTMKNAIQRARPLPVGASLVDAAGWGYPSGHAVLSTIFYSMTAYFIIKSSHSASVKKTAILSAFLLVLLISFSRVYLEVHYMSDIVAGVTGGLLWSAICTVLLEIHERRSASGAVP